jgi:hypothetical protein
VGVLPGGAADVNTTQGIYLVSAYGTGDQSIADLVGNDEATVKARYKSAYVNNSSSVWGNPSGVLAQVFGVLGAIPGMGLVEAIIAAIINAIVAVLGPIPIIGGMVETLANFLGVTHNTANTAQATGEGAQASADTANVGVAILNAKLAGTGLIFTDTFNRASASNLGTDYDRSMGSGSGTFGTDGAGNAVWSAGGATTQSCLDRVTTPMTTKYQSIAVVMTNPPQSTSTFGTFPSDQQMALRMNAAKDTYVVAKMVGGGACEIGYVNSGTYTALGAQVFPGMNNGDLWEFRAGVATSGITEDYQFDLVQNGLTVCSRIDTSHLSLNGAAPSTWVGTYDYGGLIAEAGTNVSFFTTFQMPSPTLQALTVADRTP